VSVSCAFRASPANRSVASARVKSGANDGAFGVPMPWSMKTL